jgi:putative membrane protein
VEKFIDRHGEVQPLIEKNVLPNTYESLTGNDASLVLAIMFMVVGFVLIFGIERLTNKNKSV